MNCEHNYQYQGVVYYDGYQLSGSSACARFYEDKYYCSKCLDIKYGNKREHGNNYQNPIAGTIPK